MSRSRSIDFIVPPVPAPGRPLLDVLRDAGVLLPAICSGRGTCGGCAVRVEPAPPASPADARFFTAAQRKQGIRLACFAPAVEGQRVYARTPPGEDTVAAASAVGLSGEPGPVGLAVDAGTTTVACALVSLRDGAVLSEAAAPNGQAAFGGDVISRIEYASRGRGERTRLRDALVASIRTAAAAACAACGLAEGDLRGGAVAGNPTMIHLLLGADPAFLGKAPFRLAVKGGRAYRAPEAGFPGEKDAPVAVLPLGGVTLGGDVIGGAVALGLSGAGPPRLLVDVGTNTEMLLRIPLPRGRRGARTPRAPADVLAASAASGGAFEGGNISCGMRAGTGAVTGACVEEGELRLTVTGGGPPQGVAGSGLLDLAAVLRRAGIVDPSGRMRARDELFDTVPPGLLGRIVRGRDGQPGFLLARLPGKSVLLTAGDIRQFQLAKAAIRAGIDILLSEAGIGPDAVAQVFLSGAFGAGIDGESARVTGLFPPFPDERLVRSGNSSLMAAVEAVRARAFLARTDRFARCLRIVSLADHPEFAARFLSAMEFPS